MIPSSFLPFSKDEEGGNINTARKLTREEEMQGIYLKDEQDKWIMECMMKEATEKGLKEGIEEGIEKGIKQGIEQGIEQGREQGIEQGKRENSIEIAKNLLKLNNHFH